MPHVEDMWVRKDRTRKPRYGHGKRWRAHWVEPNGARATATFKTKDAAQAHLTRMDHELRSGAYVPREQAARTLGECWPRYEAMKRGVNPETWRNYAQKWDQHIEPAWGKVPARQIKGPAVAEWLAGLKNTYTGKPMSGSTRELVRLVLRGVIQVAVDDGVIPSNPVTGVRIPGRAVTERRYLQPWQVKRLAGAARPDHLMVWTLALTGIRKGELFGLRGGDVDPVRRRLRVARHVNNAGAVITGTKTAAGRDVPLAPILLHDLAKRSRAVGADGWLFEHPRGGPYTPNRWRTVWKRALRADGVPDDLDTHELRHTAASLAIASGADVKMVQLMLGHTSAAITLDVYGHLFPSGLDDVADRMQSMFTTHTHHTGSRKPGTDLG